MRNIHTIHQMETMQQTSQRIYREAIKEDPHAGQQMIIDVQWLNGVLWLSFCIWLVIKWLPLPYV